MIIGINGYLESGKDTVGKIIQDLTKDTIEGYVTCRDGTLISIKTGSSWQIKKFAAKLKQIASILTGISVEKFEDQEFKKTFLSNEWDYIHHKGKVWYTEQDGMVEVDVMSPFTVREFLQKLGTEAMRNNIHTNAWVNALFADYKPNWTEETKQYWKDRTSEYPNWIITDTRFTNEAQAIKDRGGLVIRVNRPPVGDWDILEHHMIEKHASETSLDDWKFDWEIDNNDTREILTRKVKEMLLHFKIITIE